MLRIVSAASNALANSSLKMVVRKEPIQDRLGGFSREGS